jgi:2-methylcitrate dehydratase PrpD
LQGRIQIEQRERQAEMASLQKKVVELIDVEGRMQIEIEELKGERDRRMTEWQRNQEREREAQKAKMNEIESKCKELESKRSAMLFDFEKEKSKWSFERD